MSDVLTVFLGYLAFFVIYVFDILTVFLGYLALFLGCPVFYHNLLYVFYVLTIPPPGVVLCFPIIHFVFRMCYLNYVGNCKYQLPC